jgi:Uma2 family endonuclease
VSCESITLDTEKLLAPKLLVEVISRQGVMRDHVTKKYAYQAIPSLEEYVLVDSRRIWAALYRRFADKRSWNEHVFCAGDAVLLASIEREIAVDDLYGGLSPLLK